MTESMDPYLYHGTDVLKNLRGIRDPSTLSQFEAESTTRRIVQLIHNFGTACRQLPPIPQAHFFTASTLFPGSSTTFAGACRKAIVNTAGSLPVRSRRVTAFAFPNWISTGTATLNSSSTPLCSTV